MFAAIALAIALSTLPERRVIDFDAPDKASRMQLDSAYMQDLVTVAMGVPYGVTRMPCKAREYQPLRGWMPAREPAGKIAWVAGPTVQVKWAGIYGTCTITAPKPRLEMSEIDRTALECECNGWLPKGVPASPAP